MKLSCYKIMIHKIMQILVKPNYIISVMVGISTKTQSLFSLYVSQFVCMCVSVCIYVCILYCSVYIWSVTCLV